MRMTIGERIREVRTGKGLTQTEFAMRLEICQPNVSNIESGKHRITVEKLLRIADALGVTASELLEGVR